VNLEYRFDRTCSSRVSYVVSYWPSYDERTSYDGNGSRIKGSRLERKHEGSDDCNLLETFQNVEPPVSGSDQEVFEM
jgi:hypothetical protein